jgi:hypothetical protein
MVDYWLRSAPSGPVTLEILDSAGQVLRRYSSADHPSPRNPDTLNVQPVWTPVPESLPATAGLHRWVWDLRGIPAAGAGGRGGGRGGAGTVTQGSYTLRLTVSGKTYEHSLIIKPDPRQ